MQVYSEDLHREFKVIEVQEPLVSRPPTPNIFHLSSLSSSSLNLSSSLHSHVLNPVSLNVRGSIDSLPSISSIFNHRRHRSQSSSIRWDPSKSHFSRSTTRHPYTHLCRRIPRHKISDYIGASRIEEMRASMYERSLLAEVPRSTSKNDLPLPPQLSSKPSLQSIASSNLAQHGAQDLSARVNAVLITTTHRDSRSANVPTDPITSSVAPSTTPNSDQAGSSSPFAAQPPVKSKRTHAFLALLSSERSYASDLALIRDIHIPLALGMQFLWPLVHITNVPAPGRSPYVIGHESGGTPVWPIVITDNTVHSVWSADSHRTPYGAKRCWDHI